MRSQVEVSMLLLLLLVTVAVTSSVTLAAIFVNRIRRQRGGVSPLPADSVTAGLSLLSKAGLSTERLLNNYYDSLVGRNSDEWINVVANWLLSRAAVPRSDAATYRPDRSRGPIDFFLERLADAWLLALSERADVDCVRESTVRHLQQVLERNSGYSVDESVPQQQITVRFNKICRDAATLQQVTSLCYRETDLDEPTRLLPETDFTSSRYGEQTTMTSGSDVVPNISLENTSVSVESQNSLVIESDVQTAGEFLIQAAIVRKSSNGLASTNCNIVMKSISGRVCMELTDVDGDLSMSFYFTCLPEINLLCHPLTTDDGIKQSDVDRIENLIRSAIATAVVKLPFTTTAASSPSATAAVAAAVDSTTALQGQTLQCTFDNARRQHRKTPETNRKCDKLCWRIVVKVIKANGLRETHAGCEPYCILQLDDPPQTYTTSPVKNTNNPFFDEQFLFESDSNSIMKINFELRDLRLPPNDNFLGRAELRVDDHVTEDKCILPLVGQLGSPGTTYGSLTVQILPFDPSSNDVRSLPMELSSKANDVILRTGSRSKPLRLPASEVQSPNCNEFDQTSPNSSSTSLPPAGPVVCMSPSQQKRRSLGSVLRSRISKAMNRPSPSSTGRSLSADRASVERPSSAQNGTGTLSSPSTPTSPTRQTNAASVGALSPTSSSASGTFRTSIDIRLSDPSSVGNVDSTTSLSAVPMHPSPALSKRSAFRRLFRSRTKDSSPPAPSRSADESGRSRSASGLRSDRRKYFDEWDSPQLGR